jgi:cytochrome b pre-mRNA-processing protein 3
VFGLLRRNRHERAGFMLYSTSVIAARDPHYYRHLGVPDSLDGRFDLIGLHACLLIHRLRLLPPPGPALAQAVFDAMFSDMDVNLRELGVSDLSVGKRVKAMWEAFHGRALVYEAAFTAGDLAGLAAALRRNVWRGTLPEPSASEIDPGDDPATELARIALAQDAHLATQGSDALAGGIVSFLPAAEAV